MMALVCPIGSCGLRRGFISLLWLEVVQSWNGKATFEDPSPRLSDRQRFYRDQSEASSIVSLLSLPFPGISRSAGTEGLVPDSLLNWLASSNWMAYASDGDGEFTAISVDAEGDLLIAHNSNRYLSHALLETAAVDD